MEWPCSVERPMRKHGSILLRRLYLPRSTQETKFVLPLNPLRRLCAAMLQQLGHSATLDPIKLLSQLTNGVIVDSSARTAFALKEGKTKHLAKGVWKIEDTKLYFTGNHQSNFTWFKPLNGWQDAIKSSVITASQFTKPVVLFWVLSLPCRFRSMLTFGAESKEFSWGSSNDQTTVVGFGHGTEKPIPPQWPS